jgi:hypothetical protein
MLIGLPLLGYLLLICLARHRGADWRQSFVTAALIWGVVTIFLTETLSLVHGLQASWIALIWAFIDITLFILVFRHLRLRRAWRGDRKVRGFDAVWVGGIAIILFLTALIALVAPPNQIDVMSYHLPRIIFWLQNRSVAFYPTDDERQLNQPPGTEYGVLQVHALSGGDRFDGMIQWAAFALSLIVVTLIAKKLGAERRGQILAAVFCATIPQGLLQATGGKNDYVVAFLLAALIYYLLAFRDSPTFANMLGIGAALGLALITKGTAYFYAPPLLLAIAFIWPRQVWRRALRLAPLSVVLVLALNIAHWTRNYRLQGTPFSSNAIGGVKFANDLITPKVVFSNIVRNLALYFETPSERINRAMAWRFARLLSGLGIDASDPRTTWASRPFQLPHRPFFEGDGANPWHFLLILSVLATLIILRVQDRLLWAYLLGIIGAFVIFCGVLRWQPWHTRLHLPLFVLAAAAFGLVADRYWSRRTGTILAGILLALALPWVIYQQERPLLPGASLSILARSRTDLYFMFYPKFIPGYKAAVAAVESANCPEIKPGATPEINIDTVVGSLEYPLLVMLGVGEGKMRVRHANVRHSSRIYDAPEEGASSCVVICLECDEARSQPYLARGGQALNFDGLTVFVFKSAISP